MLANGNSNRSRLTGCLPNESLDKLKLTICVKKRPTLEQHESWRRIFSRVGGFFYANNKY